MTRYLIITALIGGMAVIGISAALATGAPENEDVTAATSLDALQADVQSNTRAIDDLQEQINVLVTQNVLATQMETGSTNFPAFTGTHCEVAFFSVPFSSIPTVYVSANHQQHQPPTTHDPVTVWIENITTNQFRACVREVDADNTHDEHVLVDWLAIE